MTQEWCQLLGKYSAFSPFSIVYMKNMKIEYNTAGDWKYCMHVNEISCAIQLVRLGKNKPTCYLGLMGINLLRVEVYFKMHSVFYFFSPDEVEDTERSYSLSYSIPCKEVYNFYTGIWGFLMNMKRSRARHPMGVCYEWFIIFGRRAAKILSLVSRMTLICGKLMYSYVFLQHW